MSPEATPLLVAIVLLVLVGAAACGFVAALVQELDDRTKQRDDAIDEYAHEHSTGPAVPDALWEVRRMAREQDPEARR